MGLTYAVIVLMLLGGFVGAKTRTFPANAAETLNRFVIYVCLPARILELVPRLEYRPGVLLLALVPWLCLPVACAAIVLAARFFRWPRTVRGALLLCVPLGNTSFLGFPMIEALLGPKAVGLAVVYDQFGSFLILSTYGLVVVAAFGDGRKPTLSEVALRIVRFPPFIALAAALLPIAHPAWLPALIEPVAATLVPLAMFAVGLKMELRVPVHWTAFGFGLWAKMFALPGLAFAAATAAGAPTDVLRVAVLESAMPPMVTAGALAMMAGLAPELAAALVGYGVLVSLASLPWIEALLP